MQLDSTAPNDANESNRPSESRSSRIFYNFRENIGKSFRTPQWAHVFIIHGAQQWSTILHGAQQLIKDVVFRVHVRNCIRAKRLFMRWSIRLSHHSKYRFLKRWTNPRLLYCASSTRLVRQRRLPGYPLKQQHSGCAWLKEWSLENFLGQPTVVVSSGKSNPFRVPWSSKSSRNY